MKPNGDVVEAILVNGFVRLHALDKKDHRIARIHRLAEVQLGRKSIVTVADAQVWLDGLPVREARDSA